MTKGIMSIDNFAKMLNYPFKFSHKHLTGQTVSAGGHAIFRASSKEDEDIHLGIYIGLVKHKLLNIYKYIILSLVP